MLYLRSRYSKRKCFFYCLFMCLTGCIIYMEIFCYYFNTFQWYDLKCKQRDRCTKILLVADPQIIGNNEEILHYITPFSIFDSDRFLRQTYLQAYNFVQPDVVIFLGDLMDEGHRASNQEFHEYIRRLFNIFLGSSTSTIVRYIWLPGDNDIGGEDSNITPEKIRRFEHAFSQPNFISYKNLNFFKINRLVSEIPVYKKKREFFDTEHLFIGLSHVPLMFKPSLFVDKVMKKMRPHLMFTAHEHKSMIINTDAHLSQDYQISPVTPDNNKIFQYTLGTKDMYEILIPTASYRMGTNKIGYGFAVIENNDLQFTVLWSPSRFLQLKIYFYIILCIFVYIILLVLFKCVSLSRCTNKIF
ncbi:metallophosphoesterase 1 homolog [Diorhabda carinulata]|uniref:metallophosphoesterase 1 homolog n=1 Tax=Diorhabda carinulata TaxID=1163345 RepID=UPI0025A03F71|nr:metallophosphoesterase 1 homolog [Diorhabda carinulata]